MGNTAKRTLPHYCNSACEEPHELYAWEREHPEDCCCDWCHENNHEANRDYVICEQCEDALKEIA